MVGLLRVRRLVRATTAWRVADRHSLSRVQFRHSIGTRGFWWGKEKEAEAADTPSPKQSSSSDPSRVDGEFAPEIPTVIALPVFRRPLFPGLFQQFTVEDEATANALQSSTKNGPGYLGVFLTRPEATPLGANGEPLESPKLITNIDDIYHYGSFAQIQQLSKTSAGTQMVVVAHRRIQLKSLSSQGPPMRVHVSHLRNPPFDAGSDLVKAYSNEMVSAIRDVLKLNPLLKDHVTYFHRHFDVQNPYRLTDFAASLTTAGAEELQDVMETLPLQERMAKVLLLLKKEIALSELQADISKQVEGKIAKDQRQYFLREQMRSIKKELGIEKDDKDALLNKFRQRLQELPAPPSAAVSTVIESEMEKLGSLERNSSEFNVTRNYLDWLTQLPWSRYSDDNFTVALARQVLSADHYGLSEVKRRVLEFIAVGKRRGAVHGKILCLVGPPGVGKTSIGRSIARSLNREFYRFSVGGLSDVAEIKGHRRTYIGAMPGKIIQCLKTVGVSNPVVLIDEIDKLGRGGHTGDPASALLELLDPEQNTGFLDHYLDVPVDLSNVLFVCTANVLDTIPGPLLDRMEVIRLSGYDLQEKVEIARTYLIPSARSDAGVAEGAEGVPSELRLTDDAVEELCRWYCREAGVRNLQQHLEKIYRRVALRVVEAEEENGDGDAEAAVTVDAEAEDVTEAVDAASASAVAPSTSPSAGLASEDASKLGVWEGDSSWVITADNVSDYVGKRVFSSERMYPETPAGVVMGLAWTSMGGASLYIETTAKGVAPAAAAAAADQDPSEQAEKQSNGGSGGSGGSGLASLTCTGHMGDVMRESVTIAHTFAANKLLQLQPTMAASSSAAAASSGSFFADTPVHVHVPEGATPKDGPSAGCTMVTALLSLATDTPVRPRLAMTGEISLTGKVLPVGGIREKTIAARRSGADVLVFPEANKKDFEELPAYIKDGLDVHFATVYDDVYAVAFPQGH